MSDIFNEVFGPINMAEKKSKVKAFENSELGLKVRTITNPDGSISINAEDTAIGFGWTTVAKSGNEVIRWARMNSYCKELGFSPQVGKEDFIPEPLFYRLGMKANNATAEVFQNWLAFEVIPSIRRTGSYEMPKVEKTKKEKLPSVNMMVKNVKGALHDAGVEPKYIAAEVVRLYSDAGYPVKVPLISDVPVLWDCTTIAKELGINSASGRPHDKAVSAIIQKISVSEAEIVKTAYSRNGHDGVTVQYQDGVLQKVRQWLEDNGYPTMIEYQLSNGNINKCKVVY